MSQKIVKVEISGAQGAGKSRVASMLTGALLGAGFGYVHTIEGEEHEKVLPSNPNVTMVHVNEKQG